MSAPQHAAPFTVWVLTWGHTLPAYSFMAVCDIVWLQSQTRTSCPWIRRTTYTADSCSPDRRRFFKGGKKAGWQQFSHVQFNRYVSAVRDRVCFKSLQAGRPRWWREDEAIRDAKVEADQSAGDSHTLVHSICLPIVHPLKKPVSCSVLWECLTASTNGHKSCELVWVCDLFLHWQGQKCAHKARQRGNLSGLG